MISNIKKAQGPDPDLCLPLISTGKWEVGLWLEQVTSFYCRDDYTQKSMKNKKYNHITIYKQKLHQISTSKAAATVMQMW